MFREMIRLTFVVLLSLGAGCKYHPRITPRGVQILVSYNSFCNTDIRSMWLKVFASRMRVS